MVHHGKFELWYNRPTKIPGRFSHETDEDVAPRRSEGQRKYVANHRLNCISQRVGEEIDTHLWAAMYLAYLMARIHITDLVSIRFSDMPDLQKLSLSNEGLSSSPPRKALEQPLEHLAADQIQILEQRLRDACRATEALWAPLNQLVRQLTSEIPEQPPDSCIAFRVFDDRSHARYFAKGVIRCGRWQEFNVKEDVTRVGARNHIEGAHIPTDYISISTSPRRSWNQVRRRWSPDLRIAVIDLRVLDRLGIAYGSTTDDLGFSNIGGKGTENATKHHVLVMGWIPSRSILGLLSEERFRELLEESGFDLSMEAGLVPLNTYDRKIPYERISRRFMKQALGKDCQRSHS